MSRLVFIFNHRFLVRSLLFHADYVARRSRTSLGVSKRARRLKRERAEIENPRGLVNNNLSEPFTRRLPGAQQMAGITVQAGAGDNGSARRAGTDVQRGEAAGVARPLRRESPRRRRQ